MPPHKEDHSVGSTHKAAPTASAFVVRVIEQHKLWMFVGFSVEKWLLDFV